MKRRISVMLLCILSALLVSCALSPAEASDPMPVDLDLSLLSGTVVYAQIYNMMYEPEPWLGKIIRMAGYYNYFDDTAHGVVYHACVVPDATACCAQGIEFIWHGDRRWPEDYPEIGTDIIVTGRLEIYEEDGRQYLHLVDAELSWDTAGQT